MADAPARFKDLCLDARDFEFPLDPIVLYLFNPLPEPALAAVLERFTASLAAHPRNAYVLYANPLLEHLLSTSRHWSRLSGDQQYAIYRWSSRPTTQDQRPTTDLPNPFPLL